MKLKADLHIHSVASPCADYNLTPQNIVEKALAVGLDAVCLTDHDTAINVLEFAAICQENNLKAFCGMEVTTKELIHVLVIFDKPQTILDLEKEIVFRLSIDELVSVIHEAGGLVVPSHINRFQNSLLAWFKKIPESKEFDAVEIDKRNFFQKLPLPDLSYPIIANSDSHQLASIGTIYTEYEVDDISVAGIKAALQAGKITVRQFSP